MSKRRVAILISGRGSNMTALIEAARAADYPAEIVVVISNVDGAEGLQKADAAGIRTATVASKGFGKDREAFEARFQDELARHHVEFICLAGFMRLLSPSFVAAWEGRMINIHPALLPSHRGLHTHERAIADGVKIHGATVHFVVSDVDAGPIVMQGAIAVRDDDTPDTLAQRVLTIEHRIYPAALRLVASGGVRIVDGVCRIAEPRSADPHVLVAPADASGQQKTPGS